MIPITAHEQEFSYEEIKMFNFIGDVKNDENWNCDRYHLSQSVNQDSKTSFKAFKLSLPKVDTGVHDNLYCLLIWLHI